MKKNKKSIPSPASNEIVPDAAPAPVAGPKTLTEHYAHWYKVLFNKLPKEEQDALLANLAKGALVVRGNKYEFSNVRDFVKSVVEKAETEYDKAQDKLKAVK